MIKITPTTKKKILAFKSIKRGYYSLIIVFLLVLTSFGAELLSNNRPLLIKYQGEYYFPTYGNIIPGSEFGFDYQTEARYKEINRIWQNDPTNENYMIMPIIPYGPYEMDFTRTDKDGDKIFPPYPPNASTSHYLGTDLIGRDVLSRLIYAFRIAILFSLALVFFAILIGISLGATTAYLGGKFDLYFIRILEIYSTLSLNSFFLIMIISSIMIPSVFSLFFLFLIFAWLGYVGDTRSLVFKEKARDYVTSARSMGATNFRILFKYILPNTAVVIIIALPFAINGGITGITTLDFLGFGLQPPTPSIGHMLQEGKANLNKPWLLIPVVTILSFLLILITFVGESLREAFDPRKYSYFE